jgi:hypothetical protein
MPELVALPLQRLACVERQRVRETVAEVQPGRMAAASAEVCVGLTSQPGAVLSHRLNHELSFRK